MNSVVASVFDFDRKPSRRLWIFAAIAALVLHLGGAALAIVNLKEDDVGAELGAQGIDVGLVFGSEKTELADLPPGPDTNESAASPALTEQKAVEKESDLPKAVPIESEEPDRIVTTADSRKPQEEEQKVAAIPTPAADPSVAQEATARPNLDQEGTGIIDQGMLRDKRKREAQWNALISACIERNKNRHYPKGKKKTASVKMSFELNRLGNVNHVDVVESSGDPAFDQAAIAMIRSCDPMPKPPTQLTDDTFSRTVSVNFNERK
ncbi:MAG TPA: TonB family protein [Bradyrhizobium sp.]|nr:TonB family protein [Bradyrhizobium sp.]